MSGTHFVQVYSEEVYSGIMSDSGGKKVTLRDATATFKFKVWTHLSFSNIDGTNKIDGDYAICKNCPVKVKYIEHHEHAKPLATPSPASPR